MESKWTTFKSILREEYSSPNSSPNSPYIADSVDFRFGHVGVLSSHRFSCVMPNLLFSLCCSLGCIFFPCWIALGRFEIRLNAITKTRLVKLETMSPCSMMSLMVPNMD